MALFEVGLPARWSWVTLQSCYRVTKKPRGLAIHSTEDIPFVPMEGIPSGGQHIIRFDLRKPSEIASGTYFEDGDVLLSKITPSFENGKQGLARQLPKPFGYASTEIIPLQTITEGANNSFLFFYLLHPEVRTFLVAKMEGSTGRQRIPEGAVRELLIPLPPKEEQEKVAALLWKVQKTAGVQEKLVHTARELKAAAMRKLFIQGLRNETLKETEIGPMPNSWEPRRLDICCDVVTSSLSYTDFAALDETNDHDSLLAMGIKVSDMNLPGNERVITHANLEKRVPLALAKRKLVPTETVVFPKRGAAIATNKKRMTSAWTVLDPNLIGVRPLEGLDPRFLFYWFQQFDLRSITEPGPTPQLNKKNLVPLVLPVPRNEEEQGEIADALDVLDRKIEHHERKRAALDDLFKSLLNTLMTGQIRTDKLDIHTSEVAAC